ncbi:hypothetical protein LCGC14_0890330 [marine sediment metagenome]|uniref:Uncharacterized protein n=1 Tax=marine sediment metagenome TaxID=412755 RepID=A0A0F9S6E8_9ZZZZ
MEDLIKELAVSSPGVVAVIVVVILFLRALRERDSTIKDIASDFANASRAQTEESKKLREAIGVNSEIIKQCQQRYEKLST